VVAVKNSGKLKYDLVLMFLTKRMKGARKDGERRGEGGVV
jgi:hypothetical protein